MGQRSQNGLQGEFVVRSACCVWPAGRRPEMLNWFKRHRDPAPGPEEIARARATRRASSKAMPTADPAPLPEVVAEGNSQDDWSVWEDSMTMLDSQMGELSAAERVYERESDRRY